MVPFLVGRVDVAPRFEEEHVRVIPPLRTYARIVRFMSYPMPPPPGPPTPTAAPIWKRWWFWVAVVVAIAAVGAAVGDGDGGADDAGVAGDSDCLHPGIAWLGTLQSAFRRDLGISSSAYVEVDTSEGTAYYVAVRVEGIPGVAVFGTSDPPLRADPGLIAAANSTARQLSDLGAEIPEDSPAGALLLDEGGTSAAASCL